MQIPFPTAFSTKLVKRLDDRDTEIRRARLLFYRQNERCLEFGFRLVVASDLWVMGCLLGTDVFHCCLTDS